MGSAVSIGHLIIDPGDMSEGSLESVGARACVAIRGSGCEALDDSPGPKVLAPLCSDSFDPVRSFNQKNL